jgi:hypothetical protein
MKNVVYWDVTRMTLVETDFSEETSASIIKVTRIGELGTLAVTSNRRTLLHAGFLFALFIHPEDGGQMFVRNVHLFSTDYAAS